jgi:hypothetical protein
VPSNKRPHCRKQRVAAKQEGLTARQRFAVVGNVAGGVAWHIEHAKGLAQHGDLIAFIQGPARLWHALTRRAPDGLGLGQAVAQCIHTADVVAVVMGDQNARQAQTLGIQGFEHRRCVAWIDHHGLTTIVQHPDVVVGESGQGDQVHV